MRSGPGINIAARLQGISKPGAICLSEDAYRQVSGRLEMAVTDLGPTQLKNIKKSIRAYSVEVGKPAQEKPITRALVRRRPLLVPLAIAIAALFAIAGGGWYLVDANRTTILASKAPQAAHLSIVVLPFANLSGDPAQDYFADGITENLTTELSRIKGSDPSRWRRAYRRRSEGRSCARPVSSSDLLDGLSFSRELPGVGTRVLARADLTDRWPALAAVSPSRRA